MSTLDTVIEMQRRGMTDSEISRTLQSQGISPKEINDSLNQAKIKSAVDAADQNRMQPRPSITEGNQGGGVAGLPGGVSSSGVVNQVPGPQGNMNGIQTPGGQYMNQNQMGGIPQGQDMMTQQPQASIMQETPQADYYPEEALYSEDQYYGAGGGGGDYYGGDYYGEGYGGGSGYSDTETITEIAEQVVNEKFNEYHKRTGDMAIFKTMMEDKVRAIEQRLTRIENSIDKLQHAVIQKIGEFGENSTIIRRDLEALHNTTSKLMNPLIDQNRELQRIRGPRTTS